jgi:hypothetical protein
MKTYHTYIVSLLVAALLVPQLSNAQVSSDTTTKLNFLIEAVKVLQTEMLSVTSVEKQSCTIKANKKSVKPGSTFKLSWETDNIASPVMKQIVKAGGMVPIDTEGTLKWVAETNKSYVNESDIFQIGYGGIENGSTFVPLCSVQVDITPSVKVTELKDKTTEAKKAFAELKGEVTCGNGNDYYDGGADIDTLTYSGKKADFEVTKLKGGGFILSDTVACRADTDVVVNIEIFKFADQTVLAKDLKSTLAKKSQSTPTGWKTYSNADFSVMYPSYRNWVSDESGFVPVGVAFGTIASKNGGYIWGIRAVEKKIATQEVLIARMGQQFSDRKEKREEIKVNGEPALLVTVTSPSNQGWVYKQVFIDGASAGRPTRTYVISNGASTEPDFATFYKSFKFN